MKKAVLLLALLCLLISPLTAIASSAYVKINTKGPAEVHAGQTYTYEITAEFNNTFWGRVHGIEAGGAFDLISSTPSGDIVYEAGQFTGASKKTITVRVKDGAQPNDKCEILIRYEYNDPYEEIESPIVLKNYKFTAVVAAEPAQTPAPTPASSSSPPPDTTQESNSQAQASKPKKNTASTSQSSSADSPLTLRIEAMPEASLLRISGTEYPLIPPDALAALKDKRGMLTVDFGHYSCTIDGAHIAALPADFGTLDLSVSMIKSAALSQAVGGLDAYQLHFAHSGPLPGRFLYAFLAAAHSPGDTLHLYSYHEASGALEAKMQAVVDASGAVTFAIDHCSGFIVCSEVIETIVNPLGLPQSSGISEDQIDQAVLAALQKAGVQDQPAISVPLLIAAVLIAASAGALIAMAFGRKKQSPTK